MVMGRKMCLVLSSTNTFCSVILKERDCNEMMSMGLFVVKIHCCQGRYLFGKKNCFTRPLLRFPKISLDKENTRQHDITNAILLISRSHISTSTVFWSSTNRYTIYGKYVVQRMIQCCCVINKA